MRRPFMFYNWVLYVDVTNDYETLGYDAFKYTSKN